MGTSRWTVCVALLGLLAAGIVQAQTPQEKKRGDILKDLGLKKKPPAPPPEATPAPPASEPPAEGAEKRRTVRRRRRKAEGCEQGCSPAGPAAPSFGRVVHPLLVSTCKACHAPGAPGGASRLLLSGDARRRSPRPRPLREHPRSGGERAARQGLRRHHARGRRALAGGRRAIPAGAGVDSGRRASRCGREGRAHRPGAERAAVAAPTRDAQRPRLAAGRTRRGPARRGGARARCAARRRGRRRRPWSPRRPPNRARRASRRRSIRC